MCIAASSILVMRLMAVDDSVPSLIELPIFYGNRNRLFKFSIERDLISMVCGAKVDSVRVTRTDVSDTIDGENEFGVNIESNTVVATFLKTGECVSFKSDKLGVDVESSDIIRGMIIILQCVDLKTFRFINV